MVQDELINELERQFAEYKSLPIPKKGKIDIDLNDADVDMYEEDSYLAGLVNRFLSHRRLEVNNIIIDSSIDSRIRQASEAVSNRELIEKYKEYRARMLNLAKALSQASGISIKYKEV